MGVLRACDPAFKPLSRHALTRPDTPARVANPAH